MLGRELPSDRNLLCREAITTTSGEIFFSEAVVGRFIESFDRADYAIDQALILTPNDVGIQEEKMRIYQARGYAELYAESRTKYNY